MTSMEKLSMQPQSLSSQEIQSELLENSQKLVPWWAMESEKNLWLSRETQKSPTAYLNSFFLFPLTEMTVGVNVENIMAFINERFHILLSTAYHANISVATIISNRKGNLQIFLGFVKEDDSSCNPEMFQTILNGILPGKQKALMETANISSLVENLNYGGLVTGIPTLIRDDKKRQRFNIASVVRSLYGKDYTLVIVSRPISDTNKQDMYRKLLSIRDRMHALAKITISKEYGHVESTGESSTESKTKTLSLLLYSQSKGGTISFTRSTSEQYSQSFTLEQQNGLALELEKISEHLLERLTRGFHTGFWETTVTFAAKDRLTCEVLGGTFLGELSKPKDILLPPPRLYIGEIPSGRTLFLPEKTSTEDTVFPKKLATYLTSEELTLIASPPAESLPGYEIRRMPPLAMTDSRRGGSIMLGHIADHGNPVPNSLFTLSQEDLNKHIFVCGLTGSGKTTTMKNILKKLASQRVPFLVLESAKRDYRTLLADEAFKNNLRIFTVGNTNISSISFNPFYIQKGVLPSTHIDYLKAIFNASFSLYGPMPNILEKCLHNIYLKKGWDVTKGYHPFFLDKNGEFDESKYELEEHFYCFPTLSDLKNEVDSYIKTETDYRGELRDNIRAAIVARLESLCVGAKGLMFNTYDFFPMKDLLNSNVVFELEDLADDDDKAFFVGLMLVLISEHRHRESPVINPGSKSKGLRHFLVIEEAHRLLKNVETERVSELMGNPKGKAVETFCNVISEIRSLGQGVAVVEQIPTKIAPDVIKNSNSKIVHRLVAKDDQILVAGSLSISDEDALYLNQLKTGHALCYKEGMERPVECIIVDDVESHAVSNDRVKETMRSFTALKPLHLPETYELDAFIRAPGKELAMKFLNSLCTLSPIRLRELLGFAQSEFEKLLVTNELNNRFDKVLFPDYVTMRLMELLNQRAYYGNLASSRNVKTILYDFLRKGEEDLYKKLMACLQRLWQVSETDTFIRKVVKETCFKYMIEHRINFIEENIRSIVSSCFLIPDEQNVRKITLNLFQFSGNFQFGDTNG